MEKSKVEICWTNYPSMPKYSICVGEENTLTDKDKNRINELFIEVGGRIQRIKGIFNKAHRNWENFKEEE